MACLRTTTGTWAHPRVGGEYWPWHSSHPSGAGSSPRGRGIQLGFADGYCAPGLIPAWAGNTSYPYSCWSEHQAHPRVGGEYTCVTHTTLSLPGSSPRGRGIHQEVSGVVRAERLIPAWAGNTLGDLGVYPGSVPFWYDFASSWRGAAHRGRRARC